MLTDARRDLLYFIFFSTFPANVNLDLPQILQQIYTGLMFADCNSNITKLFNSLSKRQVSTNLRLDLFRKRFGMADVCIFFLNVLLIFKHFVPQLLF